MQASQFIVVGGGVVGAGYVRQLLRAVAAGRLRTDRILVVDRDRACAAASLAHPLLRIDVADWSEWLAARLASLPTDAQLVPYHWAPHLLSVWLAGEAARAGGHARPGPPLPLQGLPFERPLAGGDRALSFATWTCPPACIEPALCPHTRGSKDWSLAGRLAAVRPGDDFDARIVFRCLHLVYGVGTIPVAAILAARDRVLSGLASGARTYLIGTASHCHGLAGALRVEPGPAPEPVSC